MNIIRRIERLEDLAVVESDHRLPAAWLEHDLLSGGLVGPPDDAVLTPEQWRAFATAEQMRSSVPHYRPAKG